MKHLATIAVGCLLLAADAARGSWGVCVMLTPSKCQTLEASSLYLHHYPSLPHCQANLETHCTLYKNNFFSNNRSALVKCGVNVPAMVFYDGRCLEDLPDDLLEPFPEYDPRTRPVVIPEVPIHDNFIKPQLPLPSFEEAMKWIKEHRHEISAYVMGLILAALLVYFGTHAIAAFFTSGASLTLAPASAVLLVTVLVGILQKHGYGPSSWGEPRASIDTDIDFDKQTFSIESSDLGFSASVTWDDIRRVLKEEAGEQMSEKPLDETPPK